MNMLHMGSSHTLSHIGTIAKDGAGEVMFQAT